MRLPTISKTLICTLIISAGAAPAGASTGGVAAGGTSATPSTPIAPVHVSPVTARSSRLTYKGPVYEKTITGQIVPYASPTGAKNAKIMTGGSIAATTTLTKPQLLVPGSLGHVIGGIAAAPMSAPASVQQMIWAGNQIIGLPYIFGGGHASFIAPGYDCSGTVSFALHGANLLTTPADSSEFMHWGIGGLGQWVTVFSNPGHAYMTIAGLRLDTSAADDPSNQQGPRWRPLRPANGGYRVRHPNSL